MPSVGFEARPDLERPFDAAPALAPPPRFGGDDAGTTATLVRPAPGGAAAANAGAFAKVGRNQPCPCGSGKKYKHCHGKFA